MALAAKIGHALIAGGKALGAEVAPKTNAVVIAASRADKARFVAPTSKVDASAVLGRDATVWFNAKVGAGTKVGRGACILDGAVVEENCTLGDSCVIKPGAVVKRGTTIGARVVVGVGATVPEQSSIKDSTVLVDGWNGSTVTQSSHSAIEAEEEVDNILKLATEQQVAWSRTVDEREAATRALHYARKNPVPGLKWDTFVQVNPNPNKNPERRGLIFDK